MLVSRDLDASSIRGQQLVLPACIASFELTGSADLAEAKCLIDGKKAITAARITSETYSLKLTFEKAGWNELAFAFDEVPATSANVTMPQIRTARISSAGEIVDAEITTIDDAGILAYESQPTARFLKRIASAGTPVAGEYKVVIGKLVFPVSQAGAIISYKINKGYTSIQSIGQEANYDSFGKLIFSGFVYTTEDSKPLQIIVPELSRVSIPSLSITGQLSALEVEFRAGVPAGERKAFRLYRLQGATEA